MRLLVDARKLGHGGIGTYINNLVSGLVESEQAEVTLIARNDADLNKFEKDAQIIRDDAKPYSVDELVLMPRRIRWSDFDLFHEPHFTLPLGVPIPSIVTVHDLIHINHPERWYYPLVSGGIIRSSLERAARVIAVSEATAAEIRQFVGDDAEVLEKVVVIPNSFDPEWKRPSDPNDYVSRRFGIDSEYFLSVCSMDKPHKGAKNLIEGFRLFKAKAESSASRVKLLIAGQGVSSTAHSEDVVFVAGLSQEDLINLYSSAQALVVSSLAEGFCLPALEAQVFGTPVISTPIPAVSNLLTPKDLMLSGFGPADIAKGFERFYEQANLRRELAFDYSDHLDQYSVKTVTAQLLKLYREALRSAQ